MKTCKHLKNPKSKECRNCIKSQLCYCGEVDNYISESSEEKEEFHYSDISNTVKRIADNCNTFKCNLLYENKKLISLVYNYKGKEITVLYDLNKKLVKVVDFYEESVWEGVIRISDYESYEIPLTEQEIKFLSKKFKNVALRERDNHKTKKEASYSKFLNDVNF